METSSDLNKPCPFNELEIDGIRQQFPILNRSTASGVPLAFLDNAASTQRPSSVIEAMEDCYIRYYANVHRGIHTLSEESQKPSNSRDRPSLSTLMRRIPRKSYSPQRNLID